MTQRWIGRGRSNYRIGFEREKDAGRDEPELKVKEGIDDVV